MIARQASFSLGGKAITTCLWDNRYEQEVARVIDESRV